MREAIVSRITNEQAERLIAYVVGLVLVAFLFGVAIGKVYAVIMGAV